MANPKPRRTPDRSGRFGPYGGRYVPETLIPALDELERGFAAAWRDKAFTGEFRRLLADYVGRPSPLTRADKLSALYGRRVYLKREDLNHTGAHKINNALGQVLLAKRQGKARIIAETGAGQHGVATATACALVGLKCRIYMGTEDMRRQAPNVFRMRLLGAEVVGVDSGTRTLKDAVNEALRDWVANVTDTHYCLGTAYGPHPFPLICREFQAVIGQEARKQILKAEGRLPDACLACVGGGSNAIGLFHAFVPDAQVRLFGVEAGGNGNGPGQHAARFDGGRPGVFQGAATFILQDAAGQVQGTHSVSAGLDYAAVGPEHAYLRDCKRAEYLRCSDAEALKAMHQLAELEGIIPALESSHALGKLGDVCERLPAGGIVIVNVSGRGDKDVAEVARIEGVTL
jgi:tryptophan synthase beta chain